MKKIVLLIIVFCCVPTYAQEAPIKTIGAKPKIKKVKTKGEELAAHSFTDITTHVSLLKDIPAGQLQSVTFYFNSGLINLSKKNFGIDYRDTILALVIYEVGADGKPGKILSDKQLQFVVAKDHKGALEIAISALQLPSQPQLFIGLTAINEQTGNHVVLKTRANKDAVSYIIKRGQTGWEEYNDGSGEKFAVNMVLGVRVE